MSYWPCFYHPTSAIFVDDQKGFLTALKHKLPVDLPTKLFDNPLDALANIKDQYLLCKQKAPFLFSMDGRLAELEKENESETYIGLQWNAISNPIYDLQRFALQSVLIVDCMMPELDGVTFCRQLKDNPIKKIMLTGNADHSIAIQAFNEGLIDYFLLKNSPDLMPQLTDTIKVMQKNYFSQLTDRTLGGTLSEIAPFLKDPFVINFYEKIKDELQATEFYLLDQWGSMLFISYDGTPTTVIVSPAEILENFSRVAEDHDEMSTYEALSKHEKLLFFPLQSDRMRSVSDWNAFLFPAHPFPNKNGFYYTIIKDRHQQPIHLHNLKTQNEYHKSY